MPAETSTTPVNGGPSFLSSQTTGNQLASGTIPSKPRKTSNCNSARAEKAATPAIKASNESSGRNRVKPNFMVAGPKLPQGEHAGLIENGVLSAPVICAGWTVGNVI